jgi:hypothetical protein
MMLVVTMVRGQNNDEPKITLKFQNASVIEFVESIEKVTDYTFYFDERNFDSLVVNVDVKGKPLHEVLNSLFSGTQFYYVIDQQKNIFLTKNEIKTPGRPSYIPIKSIDEIQSADALDEVFAFREQKIYEIGRKGLKSNKAEVILSGYLKHHDTIDPVIGAAITVQQSSLGTTTDNTGYYSLKLKPGKYLLKFSSLGLKPTQRNILINDDGVLHVEMRVETTTLEEVVVTSDKESNTAGLQMGTDRFNIKTIKIVPSSFGESDVLKAILTLPGVKTVGEASSGFNVRGGATDQNLILFNGSTIYNPFHFFGFFSSFNPEAIENVELFKGSVPANYGGRLASVLTISGREGSKEKYKGSAGIGLLTSRINLEGPLLKNKASFLVGARKTYSNWIFNVLPKSSGFRNTKATFQDLNLSLDYDVNTRNQIKVAGYYSKDESNLNTDTTYNYINRNFSLEWGHQYNGKLYGNLFFGLDHFDYGNFSSAEASTAYKLKFSIDQLNLRKDFTYQLNPTNSLKFGVSSIVYKVNPGSYTPDGPQSIVAPVNLEDEQGVESALHVEDNIDVTSKLSVSAGVRYSIFNYIGAQTINKYVQGVPKSEESITETKTYRKGEVIRTYHGAEPRLSARYLITEKFSVKAGYSIMRQYIHMLSNSVAISPTDIWKLSDPNIKPQYSEQISVGLYKGLGKKFETSLEGYSKKIKNYLDYRSGAVLVNNPAIEQEVLATRGKAYGAELMIKKPIGNFNGWISYTYSRIFLLANDASEGEKINRGEYYPASYDKPHDFNFTGNQKITKRFNFSLNVNYSTGRPVTIPIGVFTYGGAPKTLYSDRNGYRIPNYFRMDLSFNLEGNHKIRQILLILRVIIRSGRFCITPGHLEFII